MENLTMPIQADEDQAATPAAPQGTEPGTQVPAQHQETAINEVDVNNNASSQDEPRRASEFETARQIKRLAKQMQSLQQAFERGQQQTAPQGNQTSVPTVTNDELLKDPVGAIQRLIDAKFTGFKGELPQQLQQLTENQRYGQQRQDALKMIKTNGLVKADPEGHERITDILTEEDDDGNSLEKYSQTNPKHAAQLALKEYQNRFGSGRKSQSAPTKAQMQTTATAVHANAPKGNLDQEAALLYRQVLADPALMSDPDYRAKLDAFDKKSRMETLLNQ